jgi:hypothetical protein
MGYSAQLVILSIATRRTSLNEARRVASVNGPVWRLLPLVAAQC